MMENKRKIIFVCVHNSARSQMAEGILKHLYGQSYEVYSAGTKPSILHSLAVEAMAEIGIDISCQRSKGLGEIEGIRFDLAVTVCNAGSSCPFVPGAEETVHKEFDDPAESSEIEAFRRVRDELCRWIKDSFSDPSSLPKALGTELHLL
jgi:arsenate reductase (thioredoxin)